MSHGESLSDLYAHVHPALRATDRLPNGLTAEELAMPATELIRTLCSQAGYPSAYLKLRKVTQILDIPGRSSLRSRNSLCRGIADFLHTRYGLDISPDEVQAAATNVELAPGSMEDAYRSYVEYGDDIQAEVLKQNPEWKRHVVEQDMFERLVMRQPPYHEMDEPQWASEVLHDAMDLPVSVTLVALYTLLKETHADTALAVHQLIESLRKRPMKTRVLDEVLAQAVTFAKSAIVPSKYDQFLQLIRTLLAKSASPLVTMLYNTDEMIDVTEDLREASGVGMDVHVVTDQSLLAYATLHTPESTARLLFRAAKDHIEAFQMRTLAREHVSLHPLEEGEPPNVTDARIKRRLAEEERILSETFSQYKARLLHAAAQPHELVEFSLPDGQRVVEFYKDLAVA